MGDLSDDERDRGMGISVEYAGDKGKPQWTKLKPFRWATRSLARETQRRPNRTKQNYFDMNLVH